MALTIVYGEAGTGKSEYCLEAMKALHKKGAHTLMIVPEQFAHSAESRLIEKNGYLTDSIQATSFKRLAQKLLSISGSTRNSISKIGKSMLLSRSVLKLADSLTLYKKTVSKPGFIDSMLTFIAECKRSEITPEQLEQAASLEDGYLALKLTELAEIYKAYQDSLAADYNDSEEYLSLLSRQLKDTHILKGSYIFIDEFFRFTPAELDCVHAFLLSGAEVFVTLGAKGEDAGGIFAPVSDTAHVLQTLARESGIPIKDSVYLTEKHRFKDSDELAHFEREYHHYPPLPYPEPTKNVSLYIAPDLYTETQALATAICRAVNEQGLHFHEIAVIAGDPDVYADLIKTVFPVYNIPVFIDQKRSLLSHPIFVMLFSLLDMMTNGMETKSLLSYCKTGYSGLNREETDRLENFVLAGHLKKEDWLDDERFLQRADSVFYETKNYSETNVEDAQTLLAIRNRLVAPLLSLRERLSQNRLVKDRATALYTFFEEISLFNVVQTETDAFKSAGDYQAAQEHGEIYNLLITLLDELVVCLGDEKIGMRRLSAILSAGLSQCEISTIPPGHDQVFFGDVSRSLVKNVKALFLIGAGDNTFPPSPPAEGLIKDDERLLLAKKGLTLGPDIKKILFHNQYLVYSALCISSGSLYVSYSIADTEGKGLRPSSFIRRLKKLFPGLLITDNLKEPPSAERIVAGKASAFQYMLEHFNEDTAAVSALKQFLMKDPDYQEKYRAIAGSARYTNLVDNLSTATAKKLYGDTLHGSVTQLEKYTACPFSYFLEYALRAKERKILKIGPPDVGSLLHKLIELVSARLARENRSFAELDAETIARLADETVTELFASLFITRIYTENRLAALMRRLKVLVGKMIQVISTHVARGAFEPCAFEMAFAENGELPPVTINLLTGETITLTGRIDRIDVLKQNASLYIKIIDYKTGSKDFRLSDVYNRLSLQLAVYVVAATEGSQKLFGEPAHPAGMFYFYLADKTVKAADIKAEDALLKQFKMSGLLLRDVDMIRAMDQGIQGTSAILPASIKKDGTLSEQGGSYATAEQFQKLSAHIKKTIGDIGREILQGCVAISPCKNSHGLPCEYCRFHAVCVFDPEKDAYRHAYPLKDEIVWELLESDKEQANV